MCLRNFDQIFFLGTTFQVHAGGSYSEIDHYPLMLTVFQEKKLPMSNEQKKHRPIEVSNAGSVLNAVKMANEGKHCLGEDQS